MPSLFSLLLLATCLAGTHLHAQGPPTVVTLTGRLLSEHDAEALAYAEIYALEEQLGTRADSTGAFVLSLPPGTHTLRYDHVGCDPETRVYVLTADTTITAYLHHHDNYTETVIVTASEIAAYSRQQDQASTQILSESLERITGVSSLRTGTAAAKPVHDGLFGNRLSIQNNGIAQSGQQWGNDHSPEIDPWVAAYVRVVGGVEALKYAGPTLGATVLIEPAPLREEGEASGKAAYTLRSNGWGQVLNARLTRPGKTAYRLSATGKLRGDQRAPDYFLTNTGRREANAAVQVARFHNAAWTSRAYYSLFSTEIGVLRGSHIGNQTDLDIAINRSRTGEAPFFTEDAFSYVIQNPRQRVFHHLLKAETEWRPTEEDRFTLRYGGQLDDRKEFDVRRGSLNDRAALALQQFNHQLEAAYHRELGPDRHLDANVQYEYTNNDNQPGTGVRPLIPDYNATRGSAYLAYHQEGDRWQYHAGLRYDYQFYEAITITRPPDARVVRIETDYGALGASLEARYRLAEGHGLFLGATYRERAPQINELYSEGLHQGVASIEEGDRTLVPERSLKVITGYRGGTDGLTLTAQVYAQPIRDYIFLEPQPERRLTPRGAFPVFLYRSADAFLYGTNLQAYYQPDEKWSADARVAIVRGRNRTERTPLIYLPGDNARLGLTYYGGEWAEGWSVETGLLAVREQVNLEPEQDFLAPPPGYALLSAAVNWECPLGKGRELHVRLSSSNLLNARYRDYLDRQRYYADAPGRDVVLRVSYAW